MRRAKLEGVIASPGHVQGPVYKITDTTKPAQPRPGSIVVAEFTTPVIALALIQALGIICETGGITSHAAVISREFDKPCLVGVKGAMSQLVDGQEIILDADKGVIYEA